MDNNPTPLEKRYRQTRKYLSLALVGIIVCCIVTGFSFSKVAETEAQLRKNVEQQASVTVASDICKTFPGEPLCRIAQEVKDNPAQPITPEAVEGGQGDRGATGLGIQSFSTNSDGHLIVTFTDNSTQDLGRLQGAKGEKGEQGIAGEKGEKGDQGIPGTQGEKGADGLTGLTGAQGEPGATGAQGVQGETGAQGRSITATSIADGNLVVTYSDGISEVIGNIVGPQGPQGEKGEPGDTTTAAGPQGPQGEKGTEGRGITAVTASPAGDITVTYTDGTSVLAGTVTDTTSITSMTCSNNTLSITLSNGTSASTGVQCPGQIVAPAPQPNPEPVPQPLPTP